MKTINIEVTVSYEEIIRNLEWEVERISRDLDAGFGGWSKLQTLRRIFEGHDETGRTSFDSNQGR